MINSQSNTKPCSVPIDGTLLELLEKWRIAFAAEMLALAEISPAQIPEAPRKEFKNELV
jgi:hypothetical protein